MPVEMADQPSPNRSEGWDRMLSFGGDQNDRKSASFRLMGPSLDPDAITHATGLTPETSHRKGDPHEGAHGRQYPPWRDGMWSICSDQGSPESLNHLDDHLTWLLEQLEPHADALRRLVAEQGLRADFYCSYFMGRSNSSFEVTARNLARVVALGVDASLGFDIYGENVETELEVWTADARPPS
jgi:Domain of unknown function (DUF4279)